MLGPRVSVGARPQRPGRALRSRPLPGSSGPLPREAADSTSKPAYRDGEAVEYFCSRGDRWVLASVLLELDVRTGSFVYSVEHLGSARCCCDVGLERLRSPLQPEELVHVLSTHDSSAFPGVVCNEQCPSATVAGYQIRPLPESRSGASGGKLSLTGVCANQVWRRFPAGARVRVYRGTDAGWARGLVVDPADDAPGQEIWRELDVSSDDDLLLPASSSTVEQAALSPPSSRAPRLLTCMMRSDIGTAPPGNLEAATASPVSDFAESLPSAPSPALDGPRGHDVGDGNLSTKSLSRSCASRWEEAFYEHLSEHVNVCFHGSCRFEAVPQYKVRFSKSWLKRLAARRRARASEQLRCWSMAETAAAADLALESTRESTFRVVDSTWC